MIRPGLPGLLGLLPGRAKLDQQLIAGQLLLSQFMQALDQLLQPAPPHRLLLVAASATAGEHHAFVVLLNEFHLNGVADIGPRLRSENPAPVVRGCPRGVQPDQDTGTRRLPEARISTSISSVGMPRSITQVRLALAVSLSFDPRERSRAASSCPKCSPPSSLYVSGRPSGVTTNAITRLQRKSERLSRL